MALSKGDLFRACRWLHGYLSAFAFLALIFFSATGLVLNHPEWTRGLKAAERTQTVALDPAALAKAAAVTDPGPGLVAVVSAKAPLAGRLKNAEVVDQQAFLRLEGPKGSADVAIDLKTGQAEVTVARAPALTLLNELHKGRDSGAVWKALIDVSAIVIVLLSLVGYVLFFSLRFRLKSSLVVTAVSLALMIGAVVLLVG